MKKEGNNPGDFISKEFCNERYERIQGDISKALNVAKREIIGEIREEFSKREGLSLTAKATIVAALIMAGASIIAALLK